MAELNERDAKLVQWLNEAYAKEAELEVDLTAHIGLTEKPAYKKRLQQHLKETKAHKRQVSSRIKKLGGSPTGGPDLPGAPDAVGELAGKAVAAVKGQVGAARALVTQQAETHLRNAQEELREEHIEIAIYSRIEIFATDVGDRETAQLARSIKRDEERMAKFLSAELGRLTKTVVKAVVPADQRPRARRSKSSRGSSGSGTGKRRTAAKW
ncbi:MAG: DUF892 family protein [Thermoleophilaceae bacterium]|nr:DUF892 family protein [Thermoleophilaceae bacterium]